MTYCLGIKVKEGLLAIADTRITSGTDTTIKKKITIEQKDNFSLFIMTSGLRSVRDKALVYFTELMETKEFNKLYKAVNAFGEQIKRVAMEDKIALEKAGFKFDLNTIIGGQLRDDDDDHQKEPDEGDREAGQTGHRNALIGAQIITRQPPVVELETESHRQAGRGQ